MDHSRPTANLFHGSQKVNTCSSLASRKPEAVCSLSMTMDHSRPTAEFTVQAPPSPDAMDHSRPTAEFAVQAPPASDDRRLSLPHKCPTHETASFGSRRLRRHPDASRARFAHYVAAAVQDLMCVAPEGLSMIEYWAMLREVPEPHDLRLTARAGDLVELQKLVNRGVDGKSNRFGGAHHRAACTRNSACCVRTGTQP